MRLALLALVAALGGCALARPPALATTAIVADCTTTITMRALDPYVVEINPLIGPYPSAGESATWCALAITATHGVGDLLPAELRTPWYIGIGAIEVGFALHNLLRVIFDADFLRY